MVASPAPVRRFAIFESTAVRIVLACILAGGGALAGGALGGWLVLWVSLRSSAVRVPDVAAMELSQATATMQEVGLVVRVQEGVFDAGTPIGRVASQRPLPGFELKRGGTVMLHPSLGKEAKTVGHLAGLPVSLAEIELEAEGLRSGARYGLSEQAGAVLVVAHTPAAGSLVAPGSTVSFLVNRTPRVARYVMPDLVGMVETDATRFLRSLRFRVAAVQRVPYAGTSPGVVLRQDPGGGAPVVEGAVVGLWVSQ